MIARLSLRTKLLAAVLLLAAAALTLTSVAAVFGLRGYMLHRVDRQLVSASRGAVERAPDDTPGPPGPGGTRGRDHRGGPPVDASFYRLVSDASGAVVVSDPTFGDVHESLPALPTLTTPTVAHLKGRPFDASSADGTATWRVLVMPRTDAPGSVTVAMSMTAINQTVGDMAVKSASFGAGALLLLAVLGYLAVGQSLRHLVQVEKTAEAISAGDLTLRVPGEDNRTEVGRLAAAFNGMLTQIEAAFRDRERSEGNALASEDRMRRFVADASHELRTPLTSIRGFAELHRQGAVADAEAVTRAMRRIEQEATRMGLLVEDLLLLARMDSQRPLERKPVNLLDIAADAAADARTLAPDRPVKLAVGDGEPVVLGDDARLRQVVANLVSNALTHTPPGTAVTIGVEAVDGSALLVVADDGPGLAPEHAERVFERFYRVDTARTRAQGGSGLGLSIVASLTAAHGGVVDVVSAPGAGTRFTVRLPLHQGAPSQSIATHTVADLH